MELEKETSEAEKNQQEGEEGSAEDEEKEPIKDDAGCADAGNLEEKEGIEEVKQENGKEVESKEMKEKGGNAGEDEEVKTQIVHEMGEEEEAKSGGEEEEEDEGEEIEETGAEKKSAATNSRKRRKSETAELSSPRTPGSDRPTRERKLVERFMMNEKARNSTPKPVAIEKVL